MPSGIGMAGKGRIGVTKAHMPPLGPEKTKQILAPYKKPNPVQSPLAPPNGKRP